MKYIAFVHLSAKKASRITKMHMISPTTNKLIESVNPIKIYADMYGSPCVLHFFSRYEKKKKRCL